MNKICLASTTSNTLILCVFMTSIILVDSFVDICEPYCLNNLTKLGNGIISNN